MIGRNCMMEREIELEEVTKGTKKRGVKRVLYNKGKISQSL